MGLTEAQLKEITKKLFLFMDPPPALPRPVNTDDGSDPKHLAAIMKPVATNPRFKDLSFGVVDFANVPAKPPRVFLHNDDVFWRMGSSGKIAALLAAAQLRDDVRKVEGLKLLTKASEYDDLFSTVWSRSKNPHVFAIRGKDGCPRVSTTIDVSKSPPDFVGMDVPFDRTKLPRTDDWGRMPDFSFRDRLWLMGSKSDNVASGSSISEIGLAYMKAVQRAYGLWNDDPKKGMRMLVASHYDEVKSGTPVSRAAGAPTFRNFRGKDDESQPGVKDEYIDNTGKPHVTSQSGSVAAMTAFMIALIQNTFLNKEVSDAIKFFLADGGSDTLPGSLVHGVQAIATPSKVHSKGGALNPEPRGRGAKLALRSDLAYIESGAKKYAIVAQGLLPFTVGGVDVEPEEQGRELAKAIHLALP